jgi:uncharacterized protein (UPF0371 family)
MSSYNDVMNLMEITILRSIETASDIITQDPRKRAQVRMAALSELNGPEVKAFILALSESERDFYKKVLEITMDPMFQNINLKSSLMMNSVIGRIVMKVDKILDK